MPIHLRAPDPYLGGPDGTGWTRMSLTGGSQMWSDQCALRPKSYSSLVESLMTPRAGWGQFGPCVRSGDCDGCAVLAQFTGEKTTLVRPGEDHVLVRVLDHRPYVMVNPYTGWEGHGYLKTWSWLRRLTGWTVGRRASDEWGEAFWLHRDVAKSEVAS